MAKTVKVSIIVDDDGTMRLTERSAQKLGAGLDKVGKSARNADRQLKGAAQASSNSSKNFSKQAQGISGGLVPAYAALAATIFATTAAFSFFKSAGDLKVLQEGQLAYTATTGIAMKTLTADIRDAAQGLLDFETAAQSAAIGVAAGLNPKQITQLAEGAANVSKILGRDVTDSFNRLVRGVTKAEPELLDELGIILRLDEASQKYKTSLGLTTKELNKNQKQTAVFNDVQDQLEQKFNKINKILQPENNAFAELGIAFSDVLKGFKELVGGLATPFARFFTDNVNSLIAALGLLAVPLFKQMIPGITEWGKRTKEASEQAAKAIEKADARIRKLKLDQKNALVPDQPQVRAMNIAKEGGLQGRAGSGLRQLIDGQEALTAAQIRGMKAAAQAGKGEYKKLIGSMRDDFIAALTQMQGKALTTSQSIKQSFNRAFTQMSASAALMVAQVEAQFLRLKAAAISFLNVVAKVATTIIRIISGVGIALIVIDLIKAGLEKLGITIFSVDEKIKELTETQKSSIDRQKSLNKEYAQFVLIQKTLAEGRVGISAEAFQATGNQISSLIDNFDALSDAIKTGENESKKLGLSQYALTSTFGYLFNLVDSTTDAFGKNETVIQQGIDARKALRDANERMVQGIVASGVANTTAGREFKSLSNIIALGGDLTEKEAKRYKELGNQLVESGAKYGKLIEAREANNNEYNKAISAVTAYKTSVSDLLENLENQLQTEQDLLKDGGGNKATIDALKNRINLIQQINDLEIKYANKRLSDQLNQNLLLNNSIKLSEQRLGLEFKKKTLNTDILELDAKINLGQEDGVTLTEDKLKNLKLQRSVKNSEIKLIEKELKLAKEALVLQNRIGRAQNYFNQLRADSSSLNDELLGFELRRSELTANRAKAQKDLQDAINNGSSEEITRLTQLEKGYEIQINLLERDEKIRKNRLKLSNDLSYVENKYTRLLSGRTPFERNRLNTLKQEELNTIKITDLERQRLEIGELGDLRKRQELTNRIEALRIENELLVEQEQLAFKIADTFRNTLESSLSENIASIIKGTEKSFKDALLNIAKSVLESIADTLAKSLTEDILGSFGLYDTPASKMKNALEDGGDYIKEKIQEGLGVSGKDSSGAVSTSVSKASSKATTKAGGEIEETFFSKFTDMFKSILGGLKSIFFKLLGSLGNIGGSLAGGLGSIIGGIFGAAAGGIMPGGVTGYANGGIVKRPTLGLVGEGKMNEAVVPLPDGKAIPVSMNGAGQNNNVTVNVSMDSKGNSQTDSQSDGQQGANLGKLIAGAVQEELQRQKRPGGILSPYGAA